MINWKVSKTEHDLILQIAQRANKMASEIGRKYPVLDADMDVTAVHMNGTPLKLSELAAAPDFDFAHDVFGILRHIDRATGQLGDCFLPRYAA